MHAYGWGLKANSYTTLEPCIEFRGNDPEIYWLPAERFTGAVSVGTGDPTCCCIAVRCDKSAKDEQAGALRKAFVEYRKTENSKVEQSWTGYNRSSPARPTRPLHQRCVPALGAWNRRPSKYAAQLPSYDGAFPMGARCRRKQPQLVTVSKPTRRERGGEKDRDNPPKKKGTFSTLHMSTIGICPFNCFTCCATPRVDDCCCMDIF